MPSCKQKCALSWQKTSSIKSLKNILKHDSIALTSTDTILGLLANATETSFQKLNRIKKERQNKPYLVLIGSIQKLECFIQIEKLSSKIHTFIKQCWPGPVTLIIKARKDLPNFMTSEKRTIALRCPNHPELLALLEHFDGLFSTSANKSGQKVPQTIEYIDPDIIKNIDLIVTGSNNQTHKNSTLLDLSENNHIRIIRQGAYPIQELEKQYGSKFEK